MSIFCTECGSKFEESSKFCAKCGNQLRKLESHLNLPETSNINISTEANVTTNNSKSNFGVWLVVGFVGVVGITALQSVISMPSQAEYVTFSLTFDHLLNGGWYIWYSGLPAMAMKLQGSGMDANYLRMILWAICGFSISLIWPILKTTYKKG